MTLEGGERDGFEYDAQRETLDETSHGACCSKDCDLPLNSQVGIDTPRRKIVGRTKSNENTRSILEHLSLALNIP